MSDSWLPHGLWPTSLLCPCGFSIEARTLEWVAIPFSRGPFQPRDWTQVSGTAGRFCTVWATREAWCYLTSPVSSLHFFFILFSFYCSVGLSLPVFEFINPFYCHLVCCWTPRVYFSDKLLYPSTLWLLFGTFLYFLFVEVHSFFSQVSIIMTMILNSLTGESFISFSVRTFSEVLSCSFTWNIALYFFISLNSRLVSVH